MPRRPLAIDLWQTKPHRWAYHASLFSWIIIRLSAGFVKCFAHMRPFFPSRIHAPLTWRPMLRGLSPCWERPGFRPQTPGSSFGMGLPVFSGATAAFQRKAHFAGAALPIAPNALGKLDALLGAGAVPKITAWAAWSRPSPLPMVGYYGKGLPQQGGRKADAGAGREILGQIGKGSPINSREGRGEGRPAVPPAPAGRGLQAAPACL